MRKPFLVHSFNVCIIESLLRNFCTKSNKSLNQAIKLNITIMIVFSFIRQFKEESHQDIKESPKVSKWLYNVEHTCANAQWAFVH